MFGRILNYGCALTVQELFTDSVIIKKAKKKWLHIQPEYHTYSQYVSAILKESIKMAIMGAIYNNETFNLPLTGAAKCSISMQKIDDGHFKALRQAGGYSNIDLIDAGFKAYTPEVVMHYVSKKYKRRIFLTKEYRDVIGEGINTRRYWSTSKETTISDQITALLSHFPEAGEQLIKEVLKVGWKRLYQAMRIGCDVYSVQGKHKDRVSIYFGDKSLKRNGKLYEQNTYIHYAEKMTRKIYWMYWKKGFRFGSDYKYMYVPEDKVEEFEGRIKHDGESTSLRIEKERLYPVFDICNIKNPRPGTIYKVKLGEYPHIDPLTLFVRSMTVTDIQKVVKRDKALTYRDITSMNYNYEYIDKKCSDKHI